MSSKHLTLLLPTALLACHQTPVHSVVATHSSSMALSLDGTTLYVANPDADSVSVINTTARTLQEEILLDGAHPAVDPNGNYFPAVEPRALVLSPAAKRLYVTGERSSTLYTIDLTTNKITTVQVCAEPVGVLISSDESRVYVACSNDASVVAVDTSSGKVAGTATLTVPEASDSTQTVPVKPWALAWSTDESILYASSLLGLQGNTGSNGPGISAIDPVAMNATSSWSITDVVPTSGQDSRIANGQARGLYDLAVRPGSDELWVAHLMLATFTAENADGGALSPEVGPDLDFEDTVFPTLSIVYPDGGLDAYLSTTTAVSDNLGLNGAFGDVVSGPHAFQFTSDGKYLLLADSASDDVLGVDAVGRVEATLLRPLSPSSPPIEHQPEGIILSPDGTLAYVQMRNTGNVLVVDVSESSAGLTLALDGTDGSPIPLYTMDPMPATMRLGQHIFNTANSDELPITQNHWASCSACHVEGRSDAVTWRFLEGPRDTPSNAGGTIGTGFLFHTADRRTVQDYWRTINVEMGGSFSPTEPTQENQLNALEDYVDHAIPVPIPPHTDSTLVANGQLAFVKAGCVACHQGPLRTDSGLGNPNLDLDGGEVETETDGGVLVHDVGTCNMGKDGGFPDVAHPADDGSMRAACLFDTPALRGLVDSAPYFHDGSALTLKDALEKTRGVMGDINVLDGGQETETALIEYLKSL